MSASFQTDRIIAAHVVLANAYFELLRLIAEKPIRRRRIVKPFVRYFARAHIRRQYERLYELYMNLIVSQNSVLSQSEVDNLRKIASDLKGYYETLPNLRKYFVSAGSVIVAGIGLGGFFGLGSVVSNLLTSSNSIELFFLLSLPLFFSVIIGFFANDAFNVKRRLFTDSLQAKKYWKGRSSSAIDRSDVAVGTSIYKMEEDLYSAIGSTDQKQKEIPIDVLTNIWAGSVATIFFLIVFWIPTWNNYVNSGGADFRGIGSIFLYPTVYIGAFVIKPLNQYRKRLASGLV